MLGRHVLHVLDDVCSILCLEGAHFGDCFGKFRSASSYLIWTLLRQARPAARNWIVVGGLGGSDKEEVLSCGLFE